ncbi:MAG: YfbK domain-containing protein [Thermoguttaceae bacterium]
MNTQSLTDFVLNELDDNARREVEAAIECDPAVRAEVEEIRRVVTEIEAVMRDENVVPVAQTISKTGTKTRPAKKRWYHISLVEGLVVVSICGMLLAVLMPATRSTREAVRNTDACQVIEHSRETLTKVRATMEEIAQQPVNATKPLASAVVPNDPKSVSDDMEQRLVWEGQAAPAPESRAERVREEVADAWKKLAPEQVRRSSAAPDELLRGGIARVPESRGMSGEAAMPMERSMDRLERRSDGSEVITRPIHAIREKEMVEALRGAERSFIPNDPDPSNTANAEAYQKLAEAREERKDAERSFIPRDPYNSANDEAYQKFVENDFLKPSTAPFSTFSIDVDTAAYSTMRRFVKDGSRPPKDAVRLEEYINYFKYSYPQPKGDAPFAVVADVARCPWESQHLLARVALQGKIIDEDARPAVNLVFLIDVSGSMSASNRLPLVKRSLTELVERLQSRDRVAIVTYAGSTQVVLPSVSGNEKRAILDSIESLTSGGSTAGASGIKLAYQTARKYYTKDGQNRVVLCTDGDFNVGTTDNKTLEEMIGDEAKSGVFLTVLGFGMGNYKDERLSILAQRGNGNYGYIDSLDEAQKLLVEGLTGTLVTIAKDVKIQIDFNPKRVAAYRLLGYENRKLRDEDFHNDAKDAGEIGAGHSVTALYEIVPVGIRVPQGVDASRYAETPAGVDAAKEEASAADAHSNELLLVKLRYKEPEASKSKLIETPLVFDAGDEKEPTGDFAFAAGVALFGMLLRDSKYAGSGNFATVRELVSPNIDDDKYRQEFLDLVKKVASAK